MPRKYFKKRIPSIKASGGRKNWKKVIWRATVKNLYLAANSDQKQFEHLLEILTSDQEKHNISTRATIIDRLIAGASYRAIGKEVWTSPVIISAIKKGLTQKTYKSYWLRDRKQQERQIQINKFEKASERRARPVYQKKRTKYGTMNIRID